jgi:hypothetical protein
MDLGPFIKNVYNGHGFASKTGLNHVRKEDRQVIQDLRKIFNGGLDYHLVSQKQWKQPPFVYTTIVGDIAAWLNNNGFARKYDTFPEDVKTKIALYYEHGNFIATIQIKYEKRTQRGEWEVLPAPMDDFTFPPSFRRLRWLGNLWLKGVPLDSCRNFPATWNELTFLVIEHGKLTSLKGFPQDLPKVTTFRLAHHQITDLDHFPNALPCCTHLNLSHNRLQRLLGLPRTLPRCTHFDISHNRLRSVKGLSRLPVLERGDFRYNALPNYAHIREIRTQGNNPQVWNDDHNPIISLHGLDQSVAGPMTFLRHNLRKYPQLFPKNYQQVLKNRVVKLKAAIETYSSITIQNLKRHHDAKVPNPIPDRVFRLFDPSPMFLSRRYVAHGQQPNPFHPRHAENVEFFVKPEGPVTPFERDRIIHEGTVELYHLLRTQVPADDTVLTALARQLDISEKWGDVLL